jgi:hypothetical protein
MRKLPLSILLLAPLVALGIHACDQQPVEPEFDVADQQPDGLLASHVGNTNPFVGTWRLKSVADGDEEVNGSDLPLQWIMTLGRDGNFSNYISNDVDHLICKDPAVPPTTSCEWSGPYTYTLTTITFDDSNHPDPGNRSVDTSMYIRCGGTLYMLDDARLTFQRTGGR